MSTANFKKLLAGYTGKSGEQLRNQFRTAIQDSLVSLRRAKRDLPQVKYVKSGKDLKLQDVVTAVDCLAIIMNTDAPALVSEQYDRICVPAKKALRAYNAKTPHRPGLFRRSKVTAADVEDLKRAYGTVIADLITWLEGIQPDDMKK